MIKSMTGFGKGKYENEGRIYSVEIKSVNHKYNDISIKMPRFFSSFEDKIRRKITECVNRGKIDVFINYENYGLQENKIKFNLELAKEYVNGLMELSTCTGIECNIDIMDIAKLPEILNVTQDEYDAKIENELMIALDNALKCLIDMKMTEGSKLSQDIMTRIYPISEKILEIEELSHDLTSSYIKKLETRINELLETNYIDENRLAQEIVIFSDKSSIEEEITRLKSHINQLKNFLNQSSPIGKKMDFLIQEINREVNTIGSKANCLEITNRVVELKTEIENIREQVQNIE